MKAVVYIKLELEGDELKRLLKALAELGETKPTIEIKESKEETSVEDYVWGYLKKKGLHLVREFGSFYLLEDDTWYYYAPKRRLTKWILTKQAPSTSAINQWIRTRCQKKYFKEYLCRKFRPLIEEGRSFDELVKYLEEITPELGLEICRDKRSHKRCSEWIVEHIIYEIKFAVQVKEFEHQKENKVWEHETDPSLERLKQELLEASRDV